MHWATSLFDLDFRRA